MYKLPQKITFKQLEIVSAALAVQQTPEPVAHKWKTAAGKLINNAGRGNLL